MSTVALLLAAGRGERLGRDLPKAWLPGRCHQGTTKASTVTPGANQHLAEAASDNANEKQAPTEQVFDHAALNELLMGDEDMMRTVAETFCSDMQDQIALLRTVQASGDVQQVTAQAHKIKGASANIGGMALCSQALKMEQAGKAGDTESIQQTLPVLEQAFVQLKSALQEQLF